LGLGFRAAERRAETLPVGETGGATGTGGFAGILSTSARSFAASTACRRLMPLKRLSACFGILMSRAMNSRQPSRVIWSMGLFAPKTSHSQVRVVWYEMTVRFVHA